MFFVYNLLLKLAALLLLPRLIVDLIRGGKYADGFKERLLGPDPSSDASRPVIWLHCVSVGEANAAVPLARELVKRYPKYSLVVSTTTSTGQEVARKAFSETADRIIFFPYDFKFSVRRALRSVRPSVVLIMETEIWINFFRMATQQGARLAIVNGRISTSSARRYPVYSQAVKRVLAGVELALMQTDDDAERIRALGMNRAKVRVTGNIKFDQQEGGAESVIAEDLRSRFGFDGSRILIAAASTHEPEEEWILEAFSELRSSTPNPRLLIAPRHRDRFERVWSLIRQSGFSAARRSAPAEQEDALADVVLLDTLGELNSAFRLTDIAFVGGSLVPHGGQSMIEPAAKGNAVLVGPNTSNFKDVVRRFRDKRAIVEIPELSESDIPAALENELRRLLEDDSFRTKLAKRAEAVVDQSQGAVDRTLAELDPILTGISR